MSPATQHTVSAAGALRPPAQLSLHLHVLEPGQSWRDASACAQERAIHVIAGDAELQVDGRPQALRTGDSLRLAPGSVCELRNADAVHTLTLAIAVAAAQRPAESAWTRLAHRLAWVLRRVARRLAR